MTELNFSLHKGQLEVYNDPARFKIVVAGRRWGKTRLSAVTALVEALKDTNEYGYNLKGKNVYYIAPTFDQAKRNIWDLLKDMGKDIITNVHENNGTLTILDKCKIEVKGADRPDTLRGVGLRYVILDEYADMKPQVWEQIIAPTLTDVKGKALFIGTPKGKNHFYELYLEAELADKDWSAFTYTTATNPTLPVDEVEGAKQRLSSEAYRQEYEANFSATGSGVFKESWVKFDSKEPADGNYFVTMDPAGFADEALSSKYKRLDETAIAVVKVTPEGTWWVKEIKHGRWGIKETAERFVQTCAQVYSTNAGIEKGALLNSILPYIEETKRRLNLYPHIEALRHNNQNKAQRITWALQGRAEHGKLILNPGPWNAPFLEQFVDFPNPKAKDDMLDALSYVDQIAITAYLDTVVTDNFEPLDDIAGY
jgi:phage terminase large subunit-like protein